MQIWDFWLLERIENDFLKFVLNGKNGMKKVIIIVLTIILIGEGIYLFRLTEKLKKLERMPSVSTLEHGPDIDSE